jgi:hypothetical protein
MNTTAAPALAGYTTTEADTLAHLLESAMRHMSTAQAKDGSGYSWPHTDLRPMVEEMAGGFYALMNEAVAAGADRDLMRIYL